MRKILIFLVLICLLPTRSFASVEFFALLPNPAGDDTLGEYIEIRNTGCQAVDIGGYRLSDASQKNYTIPTQTIIESHSNRVFPYSETKITLNNSGDESITLMSSTGVVIDTENYTGTQRDNVVISLTTTDKDCSVMPPIESNTGTTSTGTSSTGSQDNSSTGEISTGSTSTGSFVPQDDGVTNTGSTSTGTTESGYGASDTSGGQGSGTTNTGASSTVLQIDSSTGGTSTGASSTGSQDSSSTGSAIGTGTTSTGSFVPQDDGSTSTGTMSTGSADSGSTSTPSIPSSSGSSSSGVIFPDIFPTRQEPTNATLSGNIWDCGTNQPCRVNVNFDPIFTGGLLTKNYLCEVITATGILATCNPNTLYFSADSSFSFRLTNRSDPSQSMSMSWSIRFTVAPDNSSTGSVSSTGSQIDSSTGGTIGTGVTNTGATSSSSGITFPEIIPTFQNYTNTANSGDTLTCVTSPCRVNFTLESIFTGSFSSKDYTCEVRYGTGVYDSCNPPQLYPVGTGAIEVVLTHKASGLQQVKTIQIVQDISMPSTLPTAPKAPDVANTQIDTNKPVAIIDFDGDMKSYYEQVNDYEFNCYTMTCSVNLTAERSYDGEGSVRYIWIYGHNDAKFTKDPGARKYGFGDHSIILRVIDEAENYTEIRYLIHVLGPKPKVEKSKKEKLEKIIKSEADEKKKKKKKLKNMDFFDPPIIELQKSKFTRDTDTYRCKTKTKSCSLNLKLREAGKGVQYTWRYDDGTTVISKNPKSKKFLPGIHSVTLSASYSGTTDILWSQAYRIQVEKIQKIKKAKKPKQPKIKITKTKTPITLIPTAYASGIPETTRGSGDMYGLAVFVILVSLLVWRQRRTYLYTRDEQSIKISLQ